MYASGNPKTKKALKERVATRKMHASEFFQPNNMFGVTVPDNGTITVEGPHYPQPHKWYAQVTLRDGMAVAVK